MDDKRLLLLGLLRFHAMHGYQLNEFIENGLALCVDIKKPTAYYVLNKLAEEGLATFSEIVDGHRPPRRVYSLTEAGEQEFQRLLRINLKTYSPVRFDGDVGLAYLDALPVEEAIPLLRERLKHLDAFQAAFDKVPKHEGSMQLIVRHQARHLEAERSWLAEVIGELENFRTRKD